MDIASVNLSVTIKRRRNEGEGKVDKTLKEIQKDVDDFIDQFNVGYFSPADQMLRMTEEIGELAREINHVYGPKQKKESEQIISLEEEMGDVLFVLVSLANSLDIQLDDAFRRTMEKLWNRDADRFEKK